MKYLFWCVLSYISGCIMYAYLIPLIFEKKNIIKLSDDSNPGVANVFINCKLQTGIVVLLLELLKGAVPIYAASKALDIDSLAFAAVMAAPVAGHAFPPKLFGTKGGKAIAVTFGVCLGLSPLFLPLLLLAGTYVFFSVIVVINPHMIRSVVTFLIFTAAAIIFVRPVAVAVGCTAMSAIVIIKHLVAGTDKDLSVSLFKSNVKRTQK